MNTTIGNTIHTYIFPHLKIIYLRIILKKWEREKIMSKIYNNFSDS